MLDKNIKSQSQSIKNWSEDDRPREKFLNKGRFSLSDAELLAILLGSGSQNESAVDLAKKILKDVSNSLVELSKLEISQLIKYKGMGDAKAIKIAAALELGRRRRQAVAEEKKSISSSKDIFEYLQAILSDKNYEEFWLIHLNTSNKITAKSLISTGGISKTIVDVRKVCKLALENNAVSIIIAHNHPSGNINPSQSDIDLTRKIKEACAVLNIILLDHIVVGENSYFSFADHNIL